MADSEIVKLFCVSFLFGGLITLVAEAFVVIPGETPMQKFARLMYKYAVLAGIGALIFK